MPDNKCKWNPKFLDYKCNEPALPDDPDSYCILHSKNEDKNLKDFTTIVENRLKGNEEIDLRGCYFPKDFPSYFFTNYSFNRPAFFVEATFLQDMHFWGKFEKKSDFSGATFSQEGCFFRTEFLEKANFSMVKFKQAEFFHTKFLQKVDFSDATFSEWVDFSGADFKEGVDFSEAKFKNKAYFLPATGRKKNELASRSSNILKRDERRSVTFGGPSSFHHTRFTGEVIFQDVDLSQCSFLHSNIDKVDFRYCTFAKKGYRRNVLMDELECDKKVNSAKSTEEKKKARGGYEPVRRLYLELKRNFENKTDWNTAGDFHFGEMECRRKMKGWWGRNILSLEALYFGLSGYGERPLRAFRILLEFVLVLFPFLYILSEGKTITEYFTSLLDSLKVATLMRLGNPIEPNTGFWKPIVAVAELIVVPILIALLALALRRKVKR